MWTPKLGRPPQGEKEINEAIEWWHREGSQALQAATKLMDAQTRQTDLRVLGWVLGTVLVILAALFVIFF